MTIHRVWIEKLTFDPSDSESEWVKLCVLMINDGLDSCDYVSLSKIGSPIDTPPHIASMEPRTDDDPLRLAERALAALRKAGGKS